jgi:hypothetical protein
MKVQPAEAQLVAKVSEQLQPYVIARYQQPIRDIQDHELKSRLNVMVTRSIIDMGHKANDEAVTTHLVKTLFDDFRRMPKFHMVTMAEVELFVSNGIRGEYPTKNGQLLAVNIANIHYWIFCGMDSEKRKRAIQEYNAALDEGLKATRPVHYTPEKWIEMSKLTFHQYRESKEKVAEHGESYGGIYDRAEGIKVNVQKAFWTNGAAAAIYDCINSHIGSQHPKYPDRKTLVPDKEIRDTLLAIAAEEVERMEKEKPGSTGQKTLEFIQKKRLLMYFFDELINQKKDLEI